MLEDCRLQLLVIVNIKERVRNVSDNILQNWGIDMKNLFSFLRIRLKNNAKKKLIVVVNGNEEIRNSGIK